MTDYYAHSFRDDPKRAADEVVDDEFDDLDVAAELGRPSPGPGVADDFEELD